MKPQRKYHKKILIFKGALSLQIHLFMLGMCIWINVDGVVSLRIVQIE
jgi:hypothetical protein